jgi:hypothetical protein
MDKQRYPCSCLRCNGILVSYSTIRRHRKNGQTVPSIADWRRQQGRPLRQEDLGNEGDIEGNEEKSGEDESEEEGGNGQEGFVMGRPRKRSRFDDHRYQVCVTRP